MRFERMEQNFSIPISTLAAGIYVVTAQQGVERSSTVFSVAR